MWCRRSYNTLRVFRTQGMSNPTIEHTAVLGELALKLAPLEDGEADES